MTHARDQIHQAVGCDPVSDECLHITNLLNEVEDDRVHAEAQKLLDMHMNTLLTHGPQVAQGLALAIVTISPYVMGDDGQWVRKSDGKPVTP